MPVRNAEGNCTTELGETVLDGLRSTFGRTMIGYTMDVPNTDALFVLQFCKLG